MSYDPRTDEGPLRRAGDNWFWHGSYTLEFMFDHDLRLRNSTSFGFVNHHPSMCNEGGCGEQRYQASNVGARAFILGASDTSLNRHMTEVVRDTLRLRSDIGTAFADLCWMPRKVEFKGSVTKRRDIRTVTLAACAAYGRGDRDLAKSLIALLVSRKRYHEELKSILMDHLKEPELLIIDDD